MTIGIICEYNPFHNGHIYHINKIKELYKDCTIILVMSGNFTQRGELSIINKWDKATLALNHGIDLVVELPFKFASQSADIFAFGAIRILKNLKVDKLVFGSELNNIDYLKEIADYQLNNKEYNNKVKNYLKEGFNYPTAMNKALEKYNINTPNDLLGLSYIKEIIKQDTNIEPISIKRTTNYHSNEINNISSASSIRNAIINNIDISISVPSDTLKYINKDLIIDNYFDLLKYKIISTNDLTLYLGIDEDLNNRIKKFINDSNSFDELIKKIKTKRYTYNRIKRTLIHILVNYTKKDNDVDYNYIRVLGFNNKGKKYLNSIKKYIEIPIITNYSNSHNLLNKDYQINSILYLKLDKSFIEREKKEIIIKN